jgi:glutamate racemase
VDPFALFSAYMEVTGVPRLEHAESTDPGLRGKTLGLINGSSWITLWSSWFGRKLLPGVKLVNAGNEAVQLSFMAAHRRGEPVPPAANIQAFARTAVDLVSLHPVDAILITCSTMNRAWPAVQEAVRPWEVPVVQIDQPMMESAVAAGKRILAVATHGPTVDNTRALLQETAEARGASVEVECAITEEAFHLLGNGDIRGHNEAIANLLRGRLRGGGFDAVVLAQLSMSVFALSFPDAIGAFGVPVLTSGEEGFRRAGEVLRTAAGKSRRP